MRIDSSDFIIIMLIAGAIYLVFDARRRALASAERKRDILRNAIQVWRREADATGATYRDLLKAVQRGNQQAVLQALARVDCPSDILELYPVIKRAAQESRDIRHSIEQLVDTESRFVEVARVCENRTGRPGLLESPAFRDLKAYHHSVASLYLTLGEQLEEWVTNGR